MASAAASTRVSRDASTVATIRLSPGSMPIRMPRLWTAHNRRGRAHPPPAVPGRGRDDPYHPGARWAWGLTRITAADETRLLWLLLRSNRVLDNASRGYALALMADVTPAQRWGVPA